MTSLLEQIDTTEDLRKLSRAQLPLLAQELRNCILHNVSRTGGHLSSNLGTVELTIALHYVYNTPLDRLVWDVGHQTYAHKILTGRREGMKTLRQYQGMSGFPKRSESVYDTFGVGHSSTSISAALGMALAARYKGEDRHVVAIIGDGAMSAGQAFEGLNNAGVSDVNMLVILNDNEMSISAPVGALTRYLTNLISVYNSAKDAAKAVLSQVPALFELAKRVETHVKNVFQPKGTVFEELGFDYIGPLDGHDLDALIAALEQIKNAKGPQFLHVITKKGQGYKLAEVDPISYHGPGKFDLSEGVKKNKACHKTYTDIFSDWICDMAAEDDRLVAITPAMLEGSGLVRFQKLYPQRCYDVGIAEQHAVTFAAGLACEGLKPVVAIYSTFLQRAYDQAIHDVALQKLPVVFAIDRAGIVGADGATHMGVFDIAYLRCIPDMGILTPADENECRRLLTTAYLQDGPVAVRYPRGTGACVCVESGLEPLPYGKGEIRRQGKKVAILAFGDILYTALEVAERLDLTVVNMRSVKPLDVGLIEDLVKTHDVLVTLEEGCIAGGAGSAVLEALQSHNVVKPVLLLGLPDQFIEHGDNSTLKSVYGLDATGIEKSIKVFLNTLNN